MTPQEHASHLLQVWQSRRHLQPIYRLIDIPQPEMASEIVKPAPAPPMSLHHSKC